MDDAWLAGFFDADGSFSFSFSLNSDGIPVKIRTKACLELRTNYHRGVVSLSSYLPILTLIADAFSVKTVNHYTRSSTGLSIYRVSILSLLSKSQLISYFDRFPLFSSKFLNYRDWVSVVDMVADRNMDLNVRGQRLTSIKSDFNTTRTTFNWNHLESFYHL